MSRAPDQRVGRPDRPRGRGKPPIQAKRQKSKNPVTRYLQETRDELRKVSWPTRDEAWQLTLIVLGVTVLAMLFLGLMDLLFQKLASLLV